MNETTTQNPIADPVLEEVWRIKDEIAAEHGYDVRKLGQAAMKSQQQNPKRLVDRSNRGAEQGGAEQAATAPKKKAS